MLVGASFVLAGTVMLIFGVVAGDAVGIVVGVVALVVMVGVAVVLPRGARRG